MIKFVVKHNIYDFLVCIFILFEPFFMKGKTYCFYMLKNRHTLNERMKRLFSIVRILILFKVFYDEGLYRRRKIDAHAWKFYSIMVDFYTVRGKHFLRWGESIFYICKKRPWPFFFETTGKFILI